MLEAIGNCENSKSSVPDGFNFCFIKSSWDVIKTNVMKWLEEFHWNGKDVNGLNSSFIVLIPKKKKKKKDEATNLSNFRPISLIGCLYKILAKVLAAILCKVMESVIAENQCARAEANSRRVGNS